MLSLSTFLVTFSALVSVGAQSSVDFHGEFTYSFLGIGSTLNPSVQISLPRSDDVIVVTGYDRVGSNSLSVFNLVPLNVNSKLGLGLSSDSSGNGLIDTTGYVQIDISQLTNISSIKISLRGLLGSDQFFIMGSSLQGYLGDVLLTAGLLGVVDEHTGAIGGAVVDHFNQVNSQVSNTVQAVGLPASGLTGSLGDTVSSTSSMVGNTVNTAYGIGDGIPILGGIIPNPFSGVVSNFGLINSLSSIGYRTLRGIKNTFDIHDSTTISNDSNTMKSATTTSTSRSLQLPLNSFTEITNSNGVQTISGTLGNNLLPTDPTQSLTTATSTVNNINQTLTSTVPVSTRVIGNVGGLTNAVVPHLGDIVERTITLGHNVNHYDFLSIKAGVGGVSIAGITISTA